MVPHPARPADGSLGSREQSAEALRLSTVSRLLAGSFAAVAIPIALAVIGCSSDGTHEAPTVVVTALPTAGGLLGQPQVESSLQPITPPSAPTLVALAQVIDFSPDGQVQWDGPDDRVTSTGLFHCGADPALKDALHLPDLITVKYSSGFFAPTLVTPPPNFVWTGYSHGDWQLWRTNDASVIYLVDSKRPDVAFEYHNLGCA